MSTWSHYQLEHHQATETQEAWETWVAPAMVGMDSASVKLQTLFCSVIFHGTKKSDVYSYGRWYAPILWLVKLMLGEIRLN